MKNFFLKPSTLIRCLFLAIILLHNPLFAKTLPSSIFQEIDGQRIMSVNLLKLGPNSPQLAQILKEIQKNPSPGAAQNAFITAMVNCIQGNFDGAQKQLQTIPKNHTLFPLGQFFWIDFQVKSRQNQATYQDIQNWIQNLENFHPTASLILSSRFDSLVYTLQLQKHSLLPSVQIGSLEIEQFIHLLEQKENRFTESKTKAIEEFSKKIQGHPQTQKDFFFRKIYELFAKTPSIVALVPSTIQKKIEEKPLPNPIEEEVIKKFTLGQKMLEGGKKAEALNSWIHLLFHYPQTETYEKTLQALRQFLKQEIDRGIDLEIYPLASLPPGPLYSEARYIWNRGLSLVAHKLFTTFLEKYPFHEHAANAHYIVASIHEEWGEPEKALEFYKKTINRYTISEFQSRSLFKVGLLSYLTDQLDEAEKHLLLELEHADTTLRKAQGHYWLYKVYKKKKKPAKANEHQNILLKNYPATMYALILDQKPKLPKDSQKEPFSSLPPSHLVDTVSLYLSVGLQDLIQNALAILSQKTVQEKYQLAKLLQQAGFYMLSMNLAFEVMNERASEGHFDIEVLKHFFPIQPYYAFFDIKQNSHVPPVLAFSVMKQESAFNPMAVSSAQAMGLLQLLLPTAQQMARKNNIQIRKWDLFNPATNILLGSTYLRDNLAQFDQNLVDTLIAYNAGPSRAKRWRERWKDLEPDAFIEMIPFQETRSYVKLILRNLYFYHALYPDVFEKSLDFKGLPMHFAK